LVGGPALSPRPADMWPLLNFDFLRFFNGNVKLNFSETT